jgi:hypothetical protein
MITVECGVCGRIELHIHVPDLAAALGGQVMLPNSRKPVAKSSTTLVPLSQRLSTLNAPK